MVSKHGEQEPAVSFSAKESRPTSFFVIKSGYVRIQIGNRMVAEFTADDIFGEMALIDSEPRSATAVAITDVELVPITENQFLFLVGQTPYFALKVMRTLAQRLRVTNKSFG